MQFMLPIWIWIQTVLGEQGERDWKSSGKEEDGIKRENNNNKKRNTKRTAKRKSKQVEHSVNI